MGRIKEAYPRGMMAAFRDILSTVARKKPFYSRTSWSRDLSDFFFFFPFMKTKNHRPIEFLKSTSARASITYHPELRVIAISLSFSIENLFRLIFPPPVLFIPIIHVQKIYISSEIVRILRKKNF